jgi:hypothetical protein
VAGFYLLAGPRWQGTAPPEITKVFRSTTGTGNVIPRIFVDDTAEDKADVPESLEAHHNLSARPVRRRNESR